MSDMDTLMPFLAEMEDEFDEELVVPAPANDNDEEGMALDDEDDMAEFGLDDEEDAA